MEFYNLIAFSIIIFSIPWLREIYFGKKYPQNNEIIKERIVFFDFMKGLAILGVILIHVAYFFDTYPFTINNILFINLMNDLARFAIPIFIISSGILLNPVQGKKGTTDFYWRKIWRIFLPYLICTTVYAFVWQQDFVTYLINLISGKAVSPYYFIIVLLELYLIYPFLSNLKDNKYFLPIAFIISLVSCFSTTLFEFYGIPLLFQLIFFFAYGMRLRDKFLNQKTNKQELPFWLGIIIIYVALILIRPEWYYNVRLFYGLAIFNLLFYFRNKIDLKRLPARMIMACGQNSLWIYLIHFSLVKLIYDYFSFLPINYYLNFFLIYFVSLSIIFLAAKFIQLIYNYIIMQAFKLKTAREYA